MNPRKTFPYFLGLLCVLTIVAMVFPFSGGAASGPQNKSTAASSGNNRNLPNYDAFSASPRRQSGDVDLNQKSSEGGHLIQSELRLGVPTFLWVSDRGPARSLVAAPTQEVNRGGGLQSIARDHLARYASRYRLSPENVANALVSNVHDTGRGPIIVKFRQEVAGVEVFRDEIAIIMNRDLQLLAISGYLTGDNTDVAQANFALDPTEAISKALQDLTSTTVSPSVLKTVAKATANSAPVSTQNDPYQLFTANKSDTPGLVLEDPVRVKQVMYHLVDQYVPAYYIETNVLIQGEDSSSVDLSGASGASWENEAYSYVISATDGQMLFRKNLIANDTYTYRVWADPVTKIPYDSPAGNDVHPKIVPLPDGTQYPFVGPNDITLQNYPFSRNDPWLPPGSTQTVGNNVNAYVDLFNPDGFNPVGSPADPATADFRALITAPGQFLHTHVPDASPATAEARQGAIQQLFYNVNFLHDWFYEAGFDEASGNAQSANFGRGGVQNDPIRAEAQDVSGRNNANMLTPADGTGPRMQMYVFDSNAVKYVDVLSPASAAGQRAVGTGQFGQQVFDLTNQLVQPSPASGCTAASFTGTAGKFVLVDREPTAGVGSCSIGTKLNNAMAAGAAGFILVNLSTTPNQLVIVTGSLPTFTIPFLTITWNDAASIKTALAVPNVVTARMRRDSAPDRDGSIDNQIVFHEWGHYISNRLIGNSAGLNSQQSSGMGEGWGDFTAMLLTVRENDSAVPSNSTFNGAYALATYATSGGANNGYYFGIRRYPYSTDMTKNPLTFKHIQDGVALPAGAPVNPAAEGSLNSEVHNTGEVWTTMLWECYASLLRDTQGASPRLTFNDAQERMKYYLVAAYKMTPSQPTFLEARDALLAAAYASDPVDYEHFFTAFAKRGAGFGAVSPDRFTLDNNGVTESFSLGSDATLSGVTLNDSVNSCDLDGILDSGETGKLAISLQNVGVLPLASTTGTVTSSTPGVTFPNGGNVTFSPFGPQSIGTASVDVAYAFGIAGVQTVDFQLDYTDPEIGAPRTVNFSLRVNTDTIPSASATDTVESTSPHWTVTSSPPIIVSGGNTFVVGAATPFVRKEVNSTQHVWHVDDIGLWSDERLTSPVFTVDGSGSFNIQFDHSFSFEFDAGGNYDGGVVEMSANGGAFTDIGGPAYNGVILNYGGVNNPNPIKGRNGFVQNSPGTIHASLTQAIAPGSTVQVRFRVGTDGGIGAAGWNLDNIAFTGVVETPFDVLVAGAGSCSAPAVDLQLSPNSLPAGTINAAYPTQLLTPSGGSAPYTYSITPFALPQGLVSDVVGGNLQISGTPTHSGNYPLTIVVNDSASHQKTFNYSLTINKVSPVITWANPANITYGTALSGTQLNATANVPGTFTYTPAAGTTLNAGASQTLSVNFVPTDQTLYSPASNDVTINVLKATPTITWNNPADITYPAALTATQLNATANTAGTFTYTPNLSTVLNAGNAQTLSVDFVPTDSSNYNNASKNVAINVLKATPTITWSNPAAITYPAALSATQLNATASVPGTLTYTPPATTVPNAGNGQTLSVNFVPTDSANYNNATKNVQINVLKGSQTINFGPLVDRPFGSAPFVVSGTASSNLPLSFSIQSGPATVNSGTVTLTGVGSVTVRASQPGDSNFNVATPVDQTFNVTQSPSALTLASSLNPSMLGQSVTFTATVVSAAGLPTGNVAFKDGGVAIGTGALNGLGVATFSTSALTIGNHVITAEYSGDASSLATSSTLSGGQAVNSPPSGVMQLSAANYSVVEGSGSVAITVTRSGDTSAQATVDYSSSDTSAPGVACSSVTGAAGDRCDYTPVVGTIHFAASQSSKTFTVFVSDDAYVEGVETLHLTLSNPGSGSLLGSQTTATLSIIDDDGGPSPNPIDNSSRFVEQLYHDFLNRAPDSSGFAFWTNEINSCGTNQACIDAKRVNVAAAFFLSIEFQQTGYLVERMYKTAYGDASAASTLGGAHTVAVPVVRLNEFLPDTQKIGLGVMVGQPGWEAALEGNKQAFATEFVGRTRFTTAYPVVMTNQTFVDTLNANAGTPLSNVERDQLVNDLNGATKSRSQVLRVIADHPNLVSAESNRAFVLMQYFGFLRRNPNDAPDTDYSGYDFWLSKLNQFNGNFVNAEMVKAFITSTEYRQRFGN